MRRLPRTWEDYSLEDIETMIKSLPKPKLTRIKENAVINKDFKKLPAFTETFDRLCDLLGKFPTQEVYAGYYLAQAELVDDFKTFPPEIYLRAMRNYMSFVREYHLYFLLRENFPEYRVIYSSKYDKIGIDFVLKNKRFRLGIRSHTNTKNAWAKMAKKNHYMKESIPVFDLVVDSKDCYKLNNFWLYGKKHIEQIKIYLGR